jgi:hypothetical protein
VHVELAEVRLVRAQGPVGQISNALSVLKKIGDRLLHVHYLSRFRGIFAELGCG